MRKAIILSLAFVLLVGAVFAQGSAESKSDVIKLTFVETMTSPARTQVLQELIAEYEALNPGIEIELVSPPYEQSDNKLTMMLNSNQELDIIETRDHTVKQFVNNGKLVDLTPYLAEWDETADLMDLTMQAAKTVNDTPYLIPQGFYVKALLVRTDVLDKYGIEIPTTMDELYAACKEITGKAPGQYGYALRGKSQIFKISDIQMLPNVGNVSTDNIYESTDGKYVFDNDAGRKAIEQYIDLYKTACPSDAINWGFNEQINGFVSGTTPFLIQDPDTLSSLAGQIEDDQFEVVMVPVGTTGKRYLDYGFSGFSIPTTSKHPDEAWDFIAWISSAENNARFCKSYGPLPVHNSTYENDPYFSTGHYKAWAEELNDENTVFVRYPLDAPQYPAWQQFQEQTMQALLMGNITVDEAIADWAEYWGY